MVDALGLSDVSIKDTGKGSELNTGNLKRSNNMATKCQSGEVFSQRLRKCVPAPKSATSDLKVSKKKAKDTQQYRRSLGGANRGTRKFIKETMDYAYKERK